MRPGADPRPGPTVKTPPARPPGERRALIAGSTGPAPERPRKPRFEALVQDSVGRMPARRPPTPPAPVPRAPRSSTAVRAAQQLQPHALRPARAPPRARRWAPRGASSTDSEVGRVARANATCTGLGTRTISAISGRRTMPPDCPGTRRRRPWMGAAAVCRGAGAALKREREPEGLLLAGQGLSSRAKRASRGRSGDDPGRHGPGTRVRPDNLSVQPGQRLRVHAHRYVSFRHSYRLVFAGLSGGTTSVRSCNEKDRGKSRPSARAPQGCGPRDHGAGTTDQRLERRPVRSRQPAPAARTPRGRRALRPSPRRIDRRARHPRQPATKPGIR
jgi:hypothetical protein